MAKPMSDNETQQQDPEAKDYAVSLLEDGVEWEWVQSLAREGVEQNGLLPIFLENCLLGPMAKWRRAARELARINRVPEEISAREQAHQTALTRQFPDLVKVTPDGRERLRLAGKRGDISLIPLSDVGSLTCAKEVETGAHDVLLDFRNSSCVWTFRDEEDGMLRQLLAFLGEDPEPWLAWLRSGPEDGEGDADG